MKLAPAATLALAALALAPQAQAQAASEFANLLESAQERIEQALQDYQGFLSETTDERVELTTDINQLENELVSLRAQERQARLHTQEQSDTLDELNERIKAIEAVGEYSAGVLAEYLTNFESRIHVAEDQRYAAELLDLRERLEAAGDAVERRIPLFFEAVTAGLDRQERLVGGTRLPGRAITPDGGVKEGQIALVGPTAYFLSQDGSAVGVLGFNSGTIEPGLTPFSPEQAATVAANFQGASPYLPLDPSLGNAFELKRAQGTLVQHLQKGGWVGYAILALGAFSLLVGLVKAIDLKGSSVDDSVDARALAHSAIHEPRDAAKQKAQAIRGPVGSMLSTGIDFVKADTETLLEAMDTVILRHQPKLERFLPFLATTAAVAPLMGLLGTVVGMIKTFTLIEVFGTGDAKSLSSGISEALVTTELGLIVAIPALVLHGIFSRIMRSRISGLEQVATDFSRFVASESVDRAQPANRESP